MLSSAQLSVAANAKAAITASEWARSFGARLGLAPRDVYRLDLCVTELVTNIASYGYEHGDGLIDLRAEASGEGQHIRLEIVDRGRPFDPLAAEPPAAGDDEIRVGGLGLTLVRGFADDCSYERRGAHNVFAFTIKRALAAEVGSEPLL
jgi:anti-sigma regulatory factor (Ser/Thr protein kinase)